MKKNVSPLRKAYKIAKKELRSCYDGLGIVAGRSHYEDYWTRDASFSCLGALALGDYKIVEKQLELLASFQRKDGMIPFLIRKFLPWFSFLGLKIKIKLRPKFRSHKALYLSEVIDSNAYFVIVFAELLVKTEDKELLEKYRPNIEKALSWCLKKIKPGESLAYEGPIAQWNDGIYKTGKTLMTNVLFYKAFKDWEDICSKYQLKTISEFIGIAAKIKKALQKDFYNGQYFIDWVDSKKHDYFDSNANFLAILWDVATKEQAEKIVDFSLKHLIDNPFVRSVYPNYPWYRVEIFNCLLRMADYHDDTTYWPEPSCLFVLCLNKIGRTKEAKKFLMNLADMIIEYNGVYEIYNHYGQKKRSVSRWNYRAEHPFARGASAFVLASKEILGI